MEDFNCRGGNKEKSSSEYESNDDALTTTQPCKKEKICLNKS
jgi:hypothetical protein